MIISPRPSILHGVAKNSSQAEYPFLWQGLVSCFNAAAGRSSQGGLSATVGTLPDWAQPGRVGNFFLASPLVIDPVKGWVVDFDGAANEWISVPANSRLNTFNKAVSVMAWVYWREALNVQGGIVESTTNGSPNTRFSLFEFTDSQLYWRVVRAGNTTALTVASPIIQNTWNHLACTYRSGDSRIYHNSKLVASSAALTGDIGSGLGENRWGSILATGWTPNILLGESLVYDRVLSPTEIDTHFQGASPLMKKRRVLGKAFASQVKPPAQVFFIG